MVAGRTIVHVVVVDTSVLIAVASDEPVKARLIALTTGRMLVAPASVWWEIGNAFSAMLKRRRLDLGSATAAIGVCRSIPVRYVDVPLESAVVLAERLGMYAYDAYLLATCQMMKAPILTLDLALANAARGVGIDAPEIAP